MESFFKDIILYNQTELIGYKIELSKSNNLNFQIISKHWKYFNQALRHIKRRSSFSKNWIKYGLTYKENGNNYYLASIPYELKFNYPIDMIRKKIPVGNYARFYHQGKMIDIVKTVSYIFKVGIPSNNLTRKYNESFEIIYFEKYDQNFNWNRDDSIIEIFLPIIK